MAQNRKYWMSNIMASHARFRPIYYYNFLGSKFFIIIIFSFFLNHGQFSLRDPDHKMAKGKRWSRKVSKENTDTRTR